MLIPFLAASQMPVVSTFTPPGSHVDDALLYAPDGTLYGSNYDGDSVWRITPDGVVSSFAGPFSNPNGLAWDGDDLLVADNTGAGVYRVAPDGSTSLFASVGNPSGIIADPNSDDFIVTRYGGSNQIVKLSPDGTVTNYLSGFPLNGPVGLAYDPDGNLLIGNFNDRVVIRVVEDTMQVVGQYPGGGPLGFIIYHNECIYGTGFGTDKIFCMKLDGQVDTLAGTTVGSADGTVDVAQFSGPNGIIQSPGGDSLIISDYDTKSLRVVSPILPEAPSGINELDATWNVQVFPNPVQEVLSVRLNRGMQNQTASSEMQLEILDLQGRILKTVSIQSDGDFATQFDVKSLPAASYLLRVSEIESGNYSSRVFHKAN